MVSQVTVPKNSKQTLPLVEKVTPYRILGICRPSPLNQKLNVGWFLPRFVDLVGPCSLHVIVETISNVFVD